jgi:transposase
VTKVELFEHIRKDYFAHQKSIRRIAKDRQVHRRVVRQAIENAVPPPRLAVNRQGGVLTLPVKALIDQWLQADLQAPRKQRHTGQRIYQRLVDEQAFSGSAVTIRGYVYLKRKILGLNARAFVPQIHLPGEEAEVDWYEAQVDFPQGRQKVYFFQMRACHSGREFHIAFSRQTQQAFLEAHVAAFDYFAGVFKRIRYDNLTSAVKKVLRGRRRIETERFIALRSHYLFESFFCLPGKEGAHEKGGVEGGVGRFRRTHLVPVPQVSDLVVLNQRLRQACERDDQRVIAGQTQSVNERWNNEHVLLQPLSADPFATAEVCCPTVNSKSLATIRGNHYSVPVAYVGQVVEAQIHAQSVFIFKRGQSIAEHPRGYQQHQTFAVLDHYLPLLKYKPGALAGSVALSQSRAQQQWPAVYDQYWQQLIAHYGQSEGGRRMVEYLWWARDFNRAEVTAVLEQALTLGCYPLSTIQCLMRQRQGVPEPVPKLTPAVLGHLIRYERPIGTVAHYDTLLTVTFGEGLNLR